MDNPTPYLWLYVHKIKSKQFNLRKTPRLPEHSLLSIRVIYYPIWFSVKALYAYSRFSIQSVNKPKQFQSRKGAEGKYIYSLMVTDFKTKHDRMSMRHGPYEAGLGKWPQDSPSKLNALCEWGVIH